METRSTKVPECHRGCGGCWAVAASVGAAALASAAAVYAWKKRLGKHKYRGDGYYKDLATTTYNSLSLPIQSKFLVVCVVVYNRRSGGVDHVVGVNGEISVIGQSLCAERGAIMHALTDPEFLDLHKVFIITSSDKLICSGNLCREWMSEVGSPDVEVVLFKGDKETAYTLREVFPHPPLFRRCGRDSLLEHAQKFNVTAENPAFSIPKVPEPLQSLQDDIPELVKSTTVFTAQDHFEQLHPLKLAAVLVLSDGSRLFASITKAIEYGSTLDPVTKLHAQLEGYKGTGKPLLVIQSDQFGNLHPPSAQGRSLFIEAGLGDVYTLCHSDNGALCFAQFSSLAPGALPIFNQTREMDAS